MPSRLLLCVACLLVAAASVAQQPNLRVAEPGRIDWVFAVANQSPPAPPADWLQGYESKAQTYALYVPTNQKPASWGLVLFISPGQRGTGLEQFRRACDEHHLIFASPHNAGNNVDTRERVRIVLDVLDDIRRRHAIDPDRTYVGGFSGGGRIACAIGFSLPEYFGGVIPICAAGDLREEPWLRHRVIDRLSVAHLTGENDFNRGEVERFRGPVLSAVGVRSKVWVVPKLGHGIPAAGPIEEGIRWLDAGLTARQKLARERPATRVSVDSTPARQLQAADLLAEGKARIKDKPTRYAGLMVLKGVLDRWPDLPESAEARSILLAQESAADRSWEEQDVAGQRKYLIARAQGLSDYATGPLPQQYKSQQASMAQAAIKLWQAIIQEGQDPTAVAEARKRLPELQKLTK